MLKINFESEHEIYLGCHIEHFVFNDGSVNVSIDVDGVSLSGTTSMTIQASLKTPEDQMALVLAVDAARELCPGVPVDLHLSYCPYGRQDQVFNKGEANGMKAWAGVINSLGFRTVTLYDPHSIAYNFIDNVVVVDQISILKRMDIMRRAKDLVLVSPDAGSNKKCHKIAKEFGMDKIVRADKIRETSTGNIIMTELYGDVEGDDCIIVDDLCDGGMTFIKLAEKLRERGANTITLFVTHGLFTKGLSVFNGLIDEIITTKTWERSTDEINQLREEFDGTFTIVN